LFFLIILSMLEKDFKNHQKEIEKLVELSQEGDANAFAQIYDFLVQPIYRYIYFKVDKSEALDLTEALFLKAWENIQSYKKEKSGSFSAWLFRIAHNLVVDHYRLRKEFVPLDYTMADEKKDSDPVFLLERQLSHEFLREAIAKINKKYQQIIILKYINELDNEIIAKIMKKSEGSIRILKFRALKALKRALEEMGVCY
jgi:RNA polymerase sigma-70 factor (ECF subfamily)